MKNKKFTSGIWVFALGLLLVASGCRSTAHIEKDKTIDFKKYKTYSWVPTKEKSLKERHSNDLVDAQVKALVEKQLKKNGWIEAQGVGEVLLDYDIMVEKNTREQNNPVYTRPYTSYYYNPITRRLNGFYTPSQMLGYHSMEIPYKEGTLTIHMIDNKTNKLVFQGWSTDTVDSYRFTNKELSSAVKSIFKKFDS